MSPSTRLQQKTCQFLPRRLGYLLWSAETAAVAAQLGNSQISRSRTKFKPLCHAGARCCISRASSCKLCLCIHPRCNSSSDRGDSTDILHLCAESRISLYISPPKDLRSVKAGMVPKFYVTLEPTFCVLRPLLFLKSSRLL